MLVLSRQVNEKIVIGQDIQVVIVDIRGDKVRIGIEAPADVSVHRKEVWDATRKPAVQAGGSDRAAGDAERPVADPSGSEGDGN